MSIGFSYKLGDGKLSEQQKQSLRKTLVPLVLLILIALSIFIVRYLDRVRPDYSEAGMYHPPDYRPTQVREEKPATVASSGVQNGLKTRSEKIAPSSTVLPVPAKALTVEPTPAATNKPMRKESIQSSTVAVLPVTPREKAGTQAASVAAGGAYTLLIGEFSGSQAAAGFRTKLQQLGITRIHEEQIKRTDPMHRLFLAHYESRPAADAELQKLRHMSAGAFITNDKGNYAVYAGSYLQEKRAVAEQQRLAGENFKLSIQTEPVTITLTRVTAGSFAGSTPAHNKANLLEKQGVHAIVIKAGSL